MKLLINNLGKTLIAVVVGLLAILLISTVFVPGVRDLIGTVFPSETNFIDNSGGAPALTLSCAKTAVEVTAGESIDLFAGITAKSSDNEDLIIQLTEDYAKVLEERSHVFVYKLDEKSNPIALKSQINTSEPGKWMVIYLVDDGVECVSTMVSYTVK